MNITKYSIEIGANHHIDVHLEATEKGFFASDGSHIVGYGPTEADACEDFLADYIAEFNTVRRPTAKVFQFPKRGRFA